MFFVLFDFNRQVALRINSVFDYNNNNKCIGGGHMYFHRTVRDRMYSCLDGANLRNLTCIVHVVVLTID